LEPALGLREIFLAKQCGYDADWNVDKHHRTPPKTNGESSTGDSARGESGSQNCDEDPERRVPLGSFGKYSYENGKRCHRGHGASAALPRPEDDEHQEGWCQTAR